MQKPSLGSHASILEIGSPSPPSLSAQTRAAYRSPGSCAAAAAASHADLLARPLLAPLEECNPAAAGNRASYMKSEVLSHAVLEAPKGGMQSVDGSK